MQVCNIIILIQVEHIRIYINAEHKVVSSCTKFDFFLFINMKIIPEDEQLLCVMIAKCDYLMLIG